MFGREALSSMVEPGMLALITTFIALFVIIAIVVYVYMALVLMTVSRKLNRRDIAWLAWIPIANFFLLPILAKKRWTWGWIILIPVANLVFSIIWTWNIFEQRKYPGWLSLIVLGGIIPFIGWIAGIANLVIWGLVAWHDK